MQEEQYIDGWRGMLVACGLRTPLQRAVTAALLFTGAKYAYKPPDREQSAKDFLMYPLLGAAAVGLLT